LAGYVAISQPNDRNGITIYNLCFELITKDGDSVRRKSDKIWELETKIEELELCNERYKIALDQIGSTIFEFNIANGNISYITNDHCIFGCEEVIENLPKSILDRHLIHPEDIEKFQSLFEEIRNGTPYAEGEYRIKNVQDSYSWYSFKITTIQDKNKPTSRAVGGISDITCQKQEIQELMRKAQHDELTGLLNKAATKCFVEDSLIGSATCALYIIDVDHFKDINDNLGHLFGDTVLAQVGGCLRRLFRASDIVGRIGGDEFMVLLKDIGDSSLIYEKAQALNQCLNQTFRGQTETYTISGSIGVSVYPKDGSTYADLYKKADIALYTAKRTGRNGCVIYEDEMRREATR